MFTNHELKIIETCLEINLCLVKGETEGATKARKEIKEVLDTITEFKKLGYANKNIFTPKP